MITNPTNNCKVFLSWSQDTTDVLRDEVKNTLLRAGMEVIPATEFPSDEIAFIQEVKKAVTEAECSVHILGSQYGETLESNDAVSIIQYQFYEARKKIENGADPFKMFIWYPPEILTSSKDPLQEEFINEVRSSILKNMSFTNADSAIRLVDDIRSMMAFDEKAKFEIKEAEIFIIFNQLDETRAEEVIDMLNDIVEPIEKLNIIQDSDMDYSEYCVQQIGMSKLVTIFFKDTADWALPFIQQIWKKVGGDSSHTPLLLIGTDEPQSNINVQFQAPKVISLIVSGDLIPLEIKVQYDNVIEKVSS